MGRSKQHGDIPLFSREAKEAVVQLCSIMFGSSYFPIITPTISLHDYPALM
jgi:hypothetical protein